MSGACDRSFSSAASSEPSGNTIWGQSSDRKPSLHRGEPGGGGTPGPAVACAEAFTPPGRARWGRDAGGGRLLVQKPALHRDEPGGGGPATCVAQRSRDGDLLMTTLSRRAFLAS